MFKSILVTTDGTEFAGKAVGTAVGLAKRLGARLTAVTVTAPFTAAPMDGMTLSRMPDEYRRWSDETVARRLEPIQAAAAAEDVPFTAVRIEHIHPYDGILEAARRHACDLIVMASHGRRGLSALLLGSETHKVLTHGHIPVLVVRPE